MYQPTTRLLTILELLQARPRLSAAELARRLEVDARTVRRYVTMLQDIGIPVEAERGRYGGYRLRPGYKLPPLMFTEEEALAVTLGLIAARRLGLSATAPATEGALAKIERVLPLPLGERIRALQDTIGFTQPPHPSLPAAADYLLSLSAVVQEHRRIRLRYRARDGAESERDVDPYGLVFHSGRWFLSGFDHRSGELRTFRVDRVLNIEPQTATFQRPAGFDAAAHLAGALATIPWGFPFEARFETTLAWARTRIPPHIANLEETDAGVTLRTQGDTLRSVARELLSISVDLDCALTVIRPPELAEEVRRLTRELLTAAERSVEGCTGHRG